MSSAPDDGLQDSHLREALRHTPDATLSAPSALSAAILNQAKAAVHAAPRPVPRPAAWFGLLQGAAIVWSRLTRPPVAAAFATVMVATSLTLLWREGLMDPPADRPPPSTATAPVAATAPRTQPAPRIALAAPAPTPGPPLGTASVPDVATAAAPARTLDSAKATVQAPTPAPAPRSAPTSQPPPAPPADATGRPLQDSPRIVEPSPPPPAPGSSQPNAEPRSSPDGATRSMPSSRAATVQGATAPRERMEERAAPRSQALGATAPVPARTAASTANSALADARLTQLPGALRNEAAHWSVQRAAGAPLPVDSTLLDWLESLTRETRSAGVQWMPASASMPTPSTDAGQPMASPDAVLVLLRDGRPQDRFLIGSAKVTWEQTGPSGARSTWVVELPQEALRRLVDGLGPASAPFTPVAPR